MMKVLKVNAEVHAALKEEARDRGMKLFSFAELILARAVERMRRRQNQKRKAG